MALSGVLMLLVHLAIGLSVWVIKKNFEKGSLKSDEFIHKYGTLTDGANLNTKTGVYWNAILMARWSTSSFVFVLLRDFYQIQLGILLAQSAIVSGLILQGRPKSDPVENKMLLFNELMVSFYLYTLFTLSDYNGINPVREECGIFLLAIVITSFAFNFFKMLVTVGKALYVKFKIR